MLDIFKGDAFSVLSLTDAINAIPFIPGRAGSVVNWNEQGVSELSIAIEQKDGILTLINPSPRGSHGTTTDKRGRVLRMLRIPHYQINDAVYADEVQGVRAFGSETQVETVQGKINSRMAEHTQQEMDPTLEFQRIGAIKGIILNADLTTLYNLFTEFEVSQQTLVNFDLTAVSPEEGAVRRLTAEVARMVARSLGGTQFEHIHAFCGDEFYDDLIQLHEVRETYLNQQEAANLRGGIGKPFSEFRFGEITFENYRGGTGTEEATPFIASDECHIFPVGVPGLFRTYYAPGDWIETVNTIGLPRYSNIDIMPNSKGVDMELQSNALSICTRPRVLIKGIAHSA